MREIPEEFQANQQGVEPIFIVQAFDKYFSNKEFILQEDVDDPGSQVYPLLKSVTGYSSLTRVDGFASADQVTVTFVDYYGWFLDYIRNEHIFDDKVKLYVAQYTADTEFSYDASGNITWPMGNPTIAVGSGHLDAVNVPNPMDKLYLIYEGQVRDNVEWDQESKEIVMTITNEVEDMFLGYTPKKEDIPIPDPESEFEHITVANIGVLRETLTETNWPFLQNEALNFPAAKLCKTPSVTVAEDTPIPATILRWSGPTHHEGEYSPWTIPQYGLDPPELDWGIEFYLPIEEQPGEVLFPLDTEITIELMWRDSVEMAALCTGKFIAQGGKNYFSSNTNNITPVYYSDIPIEGIDISTFRIKSEEIEGPTPWLQHMFVHIDSVFDNRAVHLNVPDFPQITDGVQPMFTKVSKQRGDICEVQHTRVFRSMAPPEDFYNMIQGIYGRIRAAGKVNPNTYFRGIPKGAKITQYDYYYNQVYVVSWGRASMVNAVKVDGPDGYVELDSNLYEVKFTNGEDDNRLWDGHPHCTYLLLNRDAIARTFENYALGQREEIGEEFLVDATNEGGELFPRLFPDHNVGGAFGVWTKFVLLDEEDRNDIFAECAWQAKKFFRFRPNNEINFIDRTETPQSVFTFNASNILRNSVKIGFTNYDDVVTRQLYVYQNYDQDQPLEEFRRDINRELYGDNSEEYDIYIHPNKAVAESVADFYESYFGNIFPVINLTSFLTSMGLEIFDYVTIDLPNLVFYNPADGVPFISLEDLPYNDGNLPVWEGRIMEINTRIMEGLIDYTVQLIYPYS